MYRITLVDGTVREFPDTDAVMVENFPPRTTPAKGYERTREYPPEYRRCSPILVSAVGPGIRISTDHGIVEIAKVERVSSG